MIDKLGDRATLERVEGGDHSFRVRGVKADDREIGRCSRRWPRRSSAASRRTADAAEEPPAETPSAPAPRSPQSEGAPIWAIAPDPTSAG